MKRAILVSIIAIVSTLTACNETGKQTHHHDEHEGHVHDYACPMHPEVDGHKGDKCPKCGMQLEKIKSAEDTKYKMTFSSSPEQVETGKEATLILKPINLSNESALVPLDLVHEKKIHLIAVSEDLDDFHHLHPEYSADGTYSIKETFAHGTNYILYADYKPGGAGQQLEKITMPVSGTSKTQVKYEKEKLSSSDNGISLTLRSGTGSFKTNQLLHIDGILTKDGVQIDASSLDNYLGAKAHVVLIDMKDKNYFHVHPDVDGKVLHIHTKLSTPGMYRAWIQFMYKGKLHTTDYVINVLPGDAAQDTGHHHDTHGGHHH